MFQSFLNFQSQSRLVFDMTGLALGYTDCRQGIGSATDSAVLISSPLRRLSLVSVERVCGWLGTHWVKVWHSCCLFPCLQQI